MEANDVKLYDAVMAFEGGRKACVVAVDCEGDMKAHATVADVPPGPLVILEYGPSQLEQLMRYPEVILTKAGQAWWERQEYENGACKKCGCTDDAACEGGCSWVAPGLCSSCAN